MTIELKIANNELAITQEDDVIRVQIAASGIKPIGLVKPAEASSLGIASTLKFVTGAESIAGINAAIPDKADRSQVVMCRLGWAGTAATGDVKWSLLYKWIAADTDVSGAEDATLTEVNTVSTTTNGYLFTSFTIPAPSADDRIIVVQLQRNGTDILDTSAADAHLLGILFDFVAGVTP